MRWLIDVFNFIAHFRPYKMAKFMLNLFDGRIKSCNKNKNQKLRNCLKFAYVLIKLRLFDGLQDVTTIQSTT